MRIIHSKESALMALDTLRKNKLRSGLTILGITIGIATVILMSSAINGLNSNIDQFVRALGTNDLWIYHFEAFARRPTTEELNRKKLTYEDGMALRSLPHVVAVDTELVSQNFQTGYGSVSLKAGRNSVENAVLIGATAAFKDTRDLPLAEGRMWTEGEDERSAKVVVLGHDSADTLFPDRSPLGQDVICGGSVYTVIGVFGPQPQPFGSGRNPNDNAAFFPLQTFRQLHPEILDYRIVVKYDTAANKDLVTEEVREVLRVRRKVRTQQDDNFAIFGPDALMRLWNSLTGGLFLFMVAVSSVGLIVGGVGVMNIMLVSVTERTREIGVRKAIGARKKDILLQFTIEAVTLCIIGGLLGISAGALFTLILHFVWVTVALLVSCAIGLVFGIYPAWKAATLDPIEALRYE